MDILTASDDCIISIIHRKSGNGSTGRALRATLAVYLHTDAAVRHDIEPFRATRTAGEFARPIRRAAAEAFT